jgi:hypothetical protein
LLTTYGGNSGWHEPDYVPDVVTDVVQGGGDADAEDESFGYTAADDEDALQGPVEPEPDSLRIRQPAAGNINEISTTSLRGLTVREQLGTGMCITLYACSICVLAFLYMLALLYMCSSRCRASGTGS